MNTTTSRPDVGRAVGSETNTKTKTETEKETEKDRWLRAYRQMVRIRLFEEQVNELYTRALMPGLAHLYSGEEAVAVGICEALHIDDYITSTHRGHGHCSLAVDLETFADGIVFAEIFARHPLRDNETIRLRQRRGQVAGDDRKF